ncbi:hypothetical protein [Streptomyces sp. NPDC047928]|uniref:SCO6745 family protein n=1 Tax=unclassified Streptomyces TaxID=2593676 RepID=UPI00371C84E9
MAVEPARVRQMWHMLEPLHSVLYYAPEPREEAAALGYATDEMWPSYVAFRAAPLGPVGPEQVASAFYSFSPGLVDGLVPAVWDTAAPGDVLAARLRGVDRFYRRLIGDDGVRADAIAEAAGLARRAAEAAVHAGRPLAAANAALPWPDAPHLTLWQAAAILREHRGDGHIAALLTAGLDPVEALVSFAAVGAAPTARFASRGWGEPAWSAARERLAERGLVTADGTATPAGRELRDEVERRTDALAAGPWQALGDADTARLAELLGDLWIAVIGTGLLPMESTLGITTVKTPAPA